MVYKKVHSPESTISSPIMNPELSNSYAPKAEPIRTIVPATSKIIEIANMKPIYSLSALLILYHQFNLSICTNLDFLL